MPNVLILGCSGYLGLSLAKSLLQAGTYAVWGTARTADKAKLLVQNEITPVEGNITDPEQLSSIIAENAIDVVVDATSAYEQAAQILQGTIKAAEARRDALAKENILSPKLGFIYCSGIWVHGSPSTRVSDLSPVGSSQSKGQPATVVAWRPGQEQAVLAARDVLDIAILRPGAIYGRSSWVFTSWWGVLLEAKKSGTTTAIQVPTNITTRTGLVHVDDVAAAFHAAIDRLDGRLGSWPVFDLVTETVDIQGNMEAAKAALGVTAPLDYAGTNGDPMLEALSTINKSFTSRAKTVLGWEPKRKDFVLNIPVYVKAWEAFQ